MDGPRGVEEGGTLVFGVKNQIGYAIEAVAVNGEALEADSVTDNDDGSQTAWYTVEEVYEEQEVVVTMTESGEHPEFSATLPMSDGTIIHLYAEEGVLPAGVKAEASVVTGIEDVVKANVEAEAEAAGEQKEVVASLSYNIDLLDKDGHKLDDQIWSGSVQVTFTGAPIEEKSKEADVVEVMYVATTKEDEAQAKVTANDVVAVEAVAEPVEVIGTDSVAAVTFAAEHFSTYSVVFTHKDKKKSTTLTINLENTAGDSLDGKKANYTFRDEEAVSVKTIAESIFTEITDGYMFDKAVIKNELLDRVVEIDSLRYKTSGWGNNKRQVFEYKFVDGYFWYELETGDEITFIYQDNKVQLTFDLGGYQGSQRVDPIRAKAATMVTLPDGAGLTRNGYVLLGWSTSSDSSAVKTNAAYAGYVPLGSSYEMPFRDTTLYAVWAQTSGTKNGLLTIAIRKDGTIPDEPAIRYEGYEFLVTKKSVNLLDYFSPVHTVSGVDQVKDALKDRFYEEVNQYNRNNRYWNPNTQYVEWYVIKDQRNDGAWHIDGVVRQYTSVYLNYDRNDVPSGTEYGLAPDSVECRKGEWKTVSDQNTLKWPGYEFTGWNTAADGSGTSYAAGSQIKMDSSVTLYAQWQEKNSVRIHYQAVGNGGSISRTGENLNPETGVAQGSTATAKTGYKFNGWYSDSGCTVIVSEANAFKPTRPANGWVDGTTFYAKFTAKEDVSYKVNYLEKDTNKILKAADTRTGKTFGETYEETAATITGYTVEGTGKQNIVLDAYNKEITFYYTANKNVSYKVNYLEKDTNKILKAADTRTGKTFGATYEETAPAITGYTVEGTGKQNIVLDAYNKEITFYYTADKNVSYKVNYLEKDTNKILKAADTRTGKTFGETYEETAATITGYTVEGTGKQNIVLDAYNKEITFYYTAKEDVSYKVNYLEKDTNKILKAADTRTGKTFGATYEETAATITGYTVEGTGKQNIVLDAYNKEITFYYTANKNVSYKVNYLEKDTNKILKAADTRTGKTFGATYEETAATITGYTVEGTGKQNIVLDAYNKEITFYYTANKNVSYKVNYLEKDTNKILKAADTRTGKTFGATYEETAATITGYTVEGTGKQNIMLDAYNKEITFYYTANKNVSYKVNYLEKDTNKILKAADTRTGKTFGETYEETAATITGYTVEGTGKQNIVLDAYNKEITFYYTANKNVSYKVNYLEKDTNKILKAADTRTGKTFGETYEETAATITGYTVEGTGKQNIVLDAYNKEITFYYTANKNVSYKVNYLEKDTNKILKAADTRTGKTFGETYEETAATITGYTVEGTGKQNIVLDAYNKEITFYYTANKNVSYKVNYLEKDTNKILKAADTRTGKTFGATYEETAATITGYTVEGTGKQNIVLDAYNKEITFYYTAKEDVSYKVNYLEKDTNKILKAADTRTGKTFGATYEETAATITGYTVEGTGKQNIVLDAYNKEITFYYTANKNVSYKVNYLEKDTNKILKAADTRTGKTFGAAYEETAATITGYTVEGTGKQNIVLDAYNKEITFYYTAKEDVSYKVNYLEKDTNKILKAADTRTGKTFGETYEETAPAITGYTVEGTGKQNIVLDAYNKEITFYYTANKNVSYKVNYLEKDTNKILKAADTRTGKTFGATYEETAATITGYTVEGTGKQNIVLDAYNKEITFYYTANKNVSYKVNYLEKDTNKILKAADTRTGKTFGETYEETAPAITGYTVEGTGKQNIVLDAYNKEITFYYTANKNVSYKVNYLEKDTNKILKAADTRTGKTFGATYEETAATITGYTVEGTGKQNIVLDAYNKEITFYYTANKNVSYKVNYLEKDTNKILKAADTRTGKTFGETYEETAATITGYTVEGTGKQNIVLDAYNKEITFYYTANKNVSYKVNYLEKDTNKILKAADTRTGKTFGATYEETAATITGYTVEGTGKQNIVLDAYNKEITFYYTANKNVSYKVNYLEKDTNKILKAADTRTGKTFGETYEETAATITGYTVEGTGKQNIVLDAYNKEITFYYTANKNVSYKVNYLEKDTNKILKAADTRTGKTFGETYEETAATITGYTVEGTGKQNIVLDAYNKEITFYYTAKEDVSYKVNYLEKDTNKILKAADTRTGKTFGETYEETAATITGYTVEGTGKQNIVLDAYNKEITFYYTANKNVSYKVNYLEKDTNKILKAADTRTGKTFGVTYEEIAPAITGYTVEGTGKQNIVLDAYNKEIIFFYTENEDVIVNYQSEDLTKGTVTLDTESIAPATGAPGGSEAKPADGYVFTPLDQFQWRYRGNWRGQQALHACEECCN